MGKFGKIIERFSSSLDRRDQGPNEVIAQQIVEESGGKLLAEVIQVIHSKSSIRIKNDAVMVLMAVSRINEAILIKQVDLFIDLLGSLNNRQVFGSMITLANISPLTREQVKPHLAKVLEVMDEGTVVTRDHGFTILS